MHKYILIYYISINLFSLEINMCLQGLDTNLASGWSNSLLFLFLQMNIASTLFFRSCGKTQGKCVSQFELIFIQITQDLNSMELDSAEFQTVIELELFRLEGIFRGYILSKKGNPLASYSNLFQHLITPIMIFNFLYI